MSFVTFRVFIILKSTNHAASGDGLILFFRVCVGDIYAKFHEDRSGVICKNPPELQKVVTVRKLVIGPNLISMVSTFE